MTKEQMKKIQKTDFRTFLTHLPMFKNTVSHEKPLKVRSPITCVATHLRDLLIFCPLIFFSFIFFIIFVQHSTVQYN